MKHTKQKTSSVAITFYVLAVLLLLVFAFMSWYIFDSIKEAMNQYGMTFSEFWGEMWQSIVNMFITQSLPFMVYAFISYGIGYVINELTLRNTEDVHTADAAELQESAAPEQTEAQTQDELTQASASESEQKELPNDEAKEETQTECVESKEEESAKEDDLKQAEEAKPAAMDNEEEKESQA